MFLSNKLYFQLTGGCFFLTLKLMSSRCVSAALSAYDVLAASIDQTGCIDLRLMKLPFDEQEEVQLKRPERHPGCRLAPASR